MSCYSKHSTTLLLTSNLYVMNEQAPEGLIEIKKSVYFNETCEFVGLTLSFISLLILRKLLNILKPCLCPIQKLIILFINVICKTSHFQCSVMPV